MLQKGKFLLMNHNTVSVITFGCKMNQAESEFIAERFEEKGYKVFFDEKNGKSDYYFINTCTVTSEAERKIRQTIRRIKRNNPASVIIAGGCYAHTQADEILNTGADLVLGNLEKKYIFDYIGKTGKYVDDFYWLRNNDRVLIPGNSYEDRTRIFLPIEEGCNEACAYCRIIFARGTRIRSLSQNEIISVINNYIKNGYKEIVLTGINMAYYGYGTDTDLKKLLKNIDNEFGKQEVRIRLTSLYPDSIDEDISLLMNNSDIFEKHVHLSLQHTADNVLKRMGRKYSGKDIYNAFNLMRKYNNNFSFTSDIIVGFPGETENDFSELAESLRKFKMLKTHIFRYSGRPGTKASRYENQISGEIKKIRVKELEKIASESSEAYKKDLLGLKVKVLAEKVNDENNFFGYDEFYIPHKVSGILAQKNNFYDVSIKDYEEEEVISHVL